MDELELEFDEEAEFIVPIEEPKVEDEPTWREPVDLPEKIGVSQRKVLRLVEELGWEPQLAAFIEHQGRKFYVGSGEGHSVGDLKTEAKDLDGFQIFARHPTAQLGFLAEWCDGWSAALVRDPVGILTELYHDYTPNKVEAKNAGMSEEQRLAKGARLNAAYNDGTSYLPHQVRMKKSTEFTDWLKQWVDLLTKKEDDEKPQE